MLAIFSPVTYPFFEVLHLIKYTKKKLELNKFFESERDLGTFLYEVTILYRLYNIVPIKRLGTSVIEAAKETSN